MSDKERMEEYQIHMAEAERSRPGYYDEPEPRPVREVLLDAAEMLRDASNEYSEIASYVFTGEEYSEMGERAVQAATLAGEVERIANEEVA